MKWVVLALFAACGDSASEPTFDAPASNDAPGGFPSTCDGACKTTSITASFGAATRQLDRAFYGITTSTDTLQVEAYRGGASGCPMMNSPPTDYTLVLGRVPIPTSPMPSTSPGSILDFVGDLLGGPPGRTAMAVTITPVAIDRTAGFVALDVSLTFMGGTVTGHIYATHCESLDSAS